MRKLRRGFTLLELMIAITLMLIIMLMLRSMFVNAQTMYLRAAKRVDVYSRVTAKIVEDLERGVRPWMKPWKAEHAAGRITRPLRHNGAPYSGINILMLWGSAVEQGFTAPIWMTFRQAKELDAHVRKGEKAVIIRRC